MTFKNKIPTGGSRGSFNDATEIAKLRGHLEVFLSDKRTENSSLGCKSVNPRGSRGGTLSIALQQEGERKASWEPGKHGRFKELPGRTTG